jgi:hypothetical protein
MNRNGGHLARTFVAELGGGDSESEYFARAKCTRCVPTWVGPVRKLSTWAKANPGEKYPAALLATRDRARRDVLNHVDARHNGRLKG